MSMAPSNFGFLQPDWPDLLAEARRAEAAAHADAAACYKFPLAPRRTCHAHNYGSAPPPRCH